jgi:hypothetical protein
MSIPNNLRQRIVSLAPNGDVMLIMRGVDTGTVILTADIPEAPVTSQALSL